MINRRTAMSTAAGLIATGFTHRSLWAQPSPSAKAIAPTTAGRVVQPSTAPVAPSDAIRQRDGRFRLPDGRWLGYREYVLGDGPLVFYFHGTPGSRLELDLFDSEVQVRGLCVVAVDRPGIGRSTYNGGRRILDWPSHIELLAGQFGYADAPFGVIGFSGGAPYATACAYKIPHRLTHVALVSGHTPPCAGVCPGNANRLIEFINRRPRLGNIAMRIADRRLQRRTDKMVRQIIARWSPADRQLLACCPRRYHDLVRSLNEALRCGPAGLLKDVRLLGGHWGFGVSDIRGAPVSIWQGGCDRIVTPSMGRWFHKQIAGSELTVDPRAGHVSMFAWHADDILARFATSAAAAS